MRWRLCRAGGDEVAAFVRSEQELQACHLERRGRAQEDVPLGVGYVGRTFRSWDEMLACDWARVELREVLDPTLTGANPQRSYVRRYARNIVERRMSAAQSLPPR